MKTSFSRTAPRLAILAGVVLALVLGAGRDALAQTATSTALASGPNPSNIGGTVTLTATVVPGEATGSVEFFDGVTSLGSSTLEGGVATLGITTLTAGTHTLTAAYSGDGSYAASTSPEVSQVVSTAGTSTVTAVSPAGTLSPARPTVSVAVTLARDESTPIMGFSVDFTVSSDLTVPTGGITVGGFLGASGTPAQFEVRTLGAGRYVADGVTLGDQPQCGSSATSGTLFDVALTSSAASGPGSVTINSVTLRDCGNATLPSTIVSPATVAIDNTPPSVAVTSPVGGETWIVGAAHAITWVATDDSGVANVDLESSTDGGGTWSAIPGATGIANAGTFDWTVPDAPTAAALVRVTAHDVNGNPASAASAAVFTISGTTTTGLTSDVNPSRWGETVTLTAAVTPAAASGTVAFKEGTITLGTAPLVGGSASLPVASLSVATHALTAAYGGDTTHQPSTSGPVSQVVDKASTTVALVADVSPSSFAQTVELTATVTPVAPGGGTPGGSVEFFDGATSLGVVALGGGGSAALAVSSLALGTHSLTAVYGGSASHQGATSSALSHDVVANATTTTVSSGTDPSVFGQSVTFTASVSPASATGTVEFRDGATLLGSGSLATGAATFSTAGLAVGAHGVTAVYAGTTGYLGSTSAPITQTVDKAGTTTVLASDPDPSTYGAEVTLTASVAAAAPGAGTPSSGSVEFYDGATLLGTGAVAAGVATYATAALGGGTHALTAVYLGDASYLTSTSAAHTQDVGTTATSVALGATPEPSMFQAPVTLTATVTPGAATGTVRFLDGTTLLGTGTLASGTATFSPSALAVGTHPLTAEYVSDGNHAGSTSSAVSHEVKASIVATAGANGTLSPSGTTSWSLGDTPSFTFSAATGYHVASVTVDGSPAALTSPYAFTPPIASNHTLDVEFAVNPPVPALTALAATQIRSGNDASGITRVHVSWPAEATGSTVHVYRAAYGHYPEYNDGPTSGSTPPAPAYPPTGRWALAGSVAAPGVTLDDQPPARDYWYYAAFVEDRYGTVSPVSNLTAGTLDYFLGDVTDGAPGHGDNRVTTADVSLLGAHYGITLVADDPLGYLDVGPTIDYSVNTRPVTDNVIDFEDLVMFAIDYGTVSAPRTSAAPVAAAADEVVLEAPERVPASGEVTVRLLLHGTGRVQGLSTTLSWDAAVVQPVGYGAGDFVVEQGAVVLSAKPGSVDAALLGVRDRGLTGEGELATLRFRVVAAGDARFAVKSVDARDASNHRVEVATALQRPTPAVPQVTSLAPAAPNPFQTVTTIAFGLSQPGTIELALYSVDGRRVRTLASGPFPAGEYRLTWDGRDGAGRGVAPGVYYARLVTGQGCFTRKLAFTR